LTPSPGGKQVSDGIQGISTLLIGGKENLHAIKPVGQKNLLPAVNCLFQLVKSELCVMADMKQVLF
jgi:hypothetical protein